MARMRERIFAGFGAVLFLGSACALTVYAIMETQSSSANSSSTTSSQTAQQNCTDTQTEPTVATPTAYIPTTKPVKSLQITDLTTGSGQAAKSGDCLVVKYYGTLASNGTVFDENFDKTTAFAFVLGQGQVISGWDQGMAGMKVGGTRRLVIPASLAYGSQSPSSAIPANSDLVFVVKLLRIQNS